jgi:hypothetical protein
MNKTSGIPHPANPGWHFFLYNLTSDRTETTDLWADERATAQSMFQRFEAWQSSVERSKGPEENGCYPPPAPAPTPSPPPAPPTDFHPVPGMQDAAERCGSADPTKMFGESPASTLNQCAYKCSQRPACEYISYSPACGCCWMYGACDTPEKGQGWTFKDWSSYALGK